MNEPETLTLSTMQTESTLRFERYLRAKKFNVTPHRLLIYGVLVEAPGHVTPDELLRRVEERDPMVGRATVYRTLRLLEEGGFVRAVGLDPRVNAYEVVDQREHHDHLVCLQCRKAVEVADRQIELAKRRIAEERGFILTGHVLYLYGICETCGPPVDR